MNNLLLICTVFCNQSETFIYSMFEKMVNFDRSVLCFERRNPDVFPFDEYKITALRGHKLMSAYNEAALRYDLPSPIWNKINEPSVIHAQFIPSAALARGIKRHFGGRPKIVLHIHGQDFYVPYYKGLGKYMEKYLKSADIILTPSEYVRQNIQIAFPELKNVHCYYTAINASDYPYSGPPDLSKQVRILLVGRFIPKKGFSTAIKAVARAVSRDPAHNYKLTVIGAGPMQGELEALTKLLNIADNVEIMSVKENEKVRGIYRQTHIFLAPSETAANGDQEGLPRTVTEALALGIPVIASRHAGIPEAIRDNETGLLFNEKDAFECADKILWAVNNWGKMLEFSKKGRKHFDYLFGGGRKVQIAQKYSSPLKEFFLDLEK